MKKEEIKLLNEKVNGSYEWERKAVQDTYGIKYTYIQINNKESNKYWAMNTDNNIHGNWAIKENTTCIQRVTGLENALARLKELFEGGK